MSTAFEVTANRGGQSIVSEYPHGGNDVSNSRGTLFVVATPIGNLDDVSARASTTLARVAYIAAEDTRHSARLLHHLGLSKALISLHEHNETARIERIVTLLEGGKDVALISDAGTPLISDPGYELVRAVRWRGLRVSPVPGPCSIVAALSVAGLPTDRFVYEGFLPTKPAARRRRLRELAAEPRTLVMLESAHRIGVSLTDLVDAVGPDREACVARELTKHFETVESGALAALVAWTQADANQRRGEFVVIVAGAPEQPPRASVPTDVLLEALARELPPRRAAKLVAGLSGESANKLYQQLMERGPA